MFVPPVDPSKQVHRNAPASPHVQLLQNALDQGYKDVPKGTPAGCNLAILQVGAQPLHKPVVLHSSEIAEDASQHWGSVSKQFTGACIARLVSQKKLHWDDDGGELLGLPKFRLGDAEAKAITVDQLLHMRSGLPEITTLAALVGKDDLLLSLEEKLTLLAKYPFLEFEPGKEERYCNTNYYLLAAIVEKISGKGFAEFVRDEVFGPLGMSCRCAVDPKCPVSIDGYARDYRAQRLDCQTYGATGVVGPPHAMASWNASLDRGEWNDLFALPPDVKPEEKQPIYARGLNVTQAGDYRIIHHSGSIGCFVTQFMRYEHLHDPRKTFAFFLASNVDNIPLSDKVAQDIATALAGSEGVRLILPGPPDPPRAISIRKEDALPYVGTYESRDLGSKFEIRTAEEKRTWILQLFHKKEGGEREVAAFVPTAPHVFSGPIGDSLQLTGDGVVLSGARIAPLHLTRL